MQRNGWPEVYIRLFNLVLIASLISPSHVYSYENKKPKPIYTYPAISTVIIPEHTIVPSPAPIPNPVRPKAAVVKKSAQQAVEGDYWGWCVTFAKAYLGVPQSTTWGNGGRELPLTQTPQVGAVVVFNYTHVAVIIGITADGMLILIESNFHLDGRVTMGRQVAVGDTTIRGYYVLPK